MNQLRRLIGPLLIGLILAACAGTGAGDESPSSPASPSQGASDPAPSLVPASEQPSPVGTPAEGDQRITGTLGADSIEGGCGYLQAPDGTRYQVSYPDGWELSLSPLELRDPDGTVFAGAGDEVTVTGEVATDMASICQIGPIFRAVTVER